MADLSIADCGLQIADLSFDDFTGRLSMEEKENQIAQAFLRQTADHLESDFLPRIKKCVDLLDEDNMWWRGSEAENSVGNLLLHLSGNVRQWIISGLGGAPDRRERPREFSARGGMPKTEALSRLESTVREAAAVLRGLREDDLLIERTIQGFKRTGLQAALHVVEHFSYHTGQIVFITKLRTQTDLKFYNL
jgi:uncharacterized damage-inducible protein DinB